MLSNRSTEISRRAFILATAVLAAACIRNEPGGRLRLAAGDPGGLYLAFAEILAERLHARFPDITVDVLPTEGTVENLARLRTGDVDRATRVADAHRRQAERKGRPWALARAWRTTGLLSGDDDLDTSFGTALRLHAGRGCGGPDDGSTRGTRWSRPTRRSSGSGRGRGPPPPRTSWRPPE